MSLRGFLPCKNSVLLMRCARGHVVGYIGGGINDVPSLHTRM
ncbi:hypothetical protein [Legionella wadsworthii]|nr:hypothetical protein [Legionella wadsworthii]